MNSHFKVLATTSWLSLVLCAAVLFYLAISAPNTVLVSTAEGRDESVRKTESSTDLRYVRQRAKELVQLGWVTSQRSLLLCRLAIGTLFLVIVGASINLAQIRRLRRQIVHVTNNTDAATPVQLTVAGASVAAPSRQRTSATEDAATLGPLAATPTGYADTLPARSLTTFQFAVK